MNTMNHWYWFPVWIRSVQSHPPPLPFWATCLESIIWTDWSSASILPLRWHITTYYTSSRDVLISDSISPVSIWLLGSDKGAFISYVMALSLKKSDVPLYKHPYVIFVYMFTGFPSQQPLPGLWYLYECYGVRFQFNVGTRSRILSL